MAKKIKPSLCMPLHQNKNEGIQNTKAISIKSVSSEFFFYHPIESNASKKEKEVEKDYISIIIFKSEYIYNSTIFIIERSLRLFQYEFFAMNKLPARIITIRKNVVYKS